MKNCLPSIVSAALCLSLVMTPFVPVAAAYADVDPPREQRDLRRRQLRRKLRYIPF